MTRAEASKKIRNNLNDLGITYYTDKDINESIQDAYDEIVVYSECIEKWIDLPVNTLIATEGGANPWVHISRIIADYYRPIALLNQTTRLFLSPLMDREQDDYRWDWQLGNGSVGDFIINGPEWLALPNSYTNVGNKPLRLFYKAKAPKMLVDTDFFRILEGFQILIEHYCTADLLEQNQEFSKATGYWNQYEPKLEEYRNKIQLLSKSDRVFNRP